VIDHGFKPRLDQTKKHSVIDHGFKSRLDQTKIHSVIVHGFEPRLDQVKKQCDRSWVRTPVRSNQKT
jgi:hypothetical protein